MRKPYSVSMQWRLGLAGAGWFLAMSGALAADCVVGVPYDASTTCEVPAGKNQMVVRAWGGGGAGSTSVSSGVGTGSGGGGGAFCGATVAVTAGQTLTLTVGAGGPRASTFAGNAGGDTSVTGSGVGGIVAGGGAGAGGQFNAGAGGSTTNCVAQNAVAWAGGPGGLGRQSGDVGFGAGGGGSATSTQAGGFGQSGFDGGQGGNGEGSGGNGGAQANASGGQNGNAPGGGGGGAGAGTVGYSGGGGAGAAGRIVFVAFNTTPTIAKAFNPTSIPVGGSSLVTITLSNGNNFDLTNAFFSDTLTNMSAVGGSVGGTCVGTLPSTLSAGATALNFSGITIPANGSCTVTFSVTSNSPGNRGNTTTGVTTTQTPVAGAGSNTAVLQVTATAPTIAKSFNPASIQSGGTSLVTLTLTNANAINLTGGAFSDPLTNMSAVGGAVGGTCVGTTPNSLSAGATALGFTGITIPANGSCTVTFSVTSNTAGNHPNATTGMTVTQIQGVGAASNSVVLSVLPWTAATIAKAFGPATITAGGNSLVTLTLSNGNLANLTGGAFSDTLTNMSAVGGAVGGTCVGTTPSSLSAGATALNFTGITIPANGSCTVTFSVTSNTVGNHPNTTSGVTATQTQVAGAASNTATLAVQAVPVVAAAPVPTLSERGLLAAAALMLLGSLVAQRRRKRKRS